MVPNTLEMRTSDHRPLALDCAISRGLLGEYPKLRRVVPLVDSIVVAPTYRANRVLKHSSDEASAITHEYPGEATNPTSYEELQAFFADRRASLLHFICHGRNEEHGIQSIDLGKNKMQSTVVVSSALRDSCIDSHPLVFLNACEVGGASQGITSVDGFAPAFMKVGAGCVIAPLWPVDDGVAFAFATGFYKRVKANPQRPFAEIVSELRQGAYGSEAVDTWAAYVVYADPLASSETRTPVL